MFVVIDKSLYLSLFLTTIVEMDNVNSDISNKNRHKICHIDKSGLIFKAKNKRKMLNIVVFAFVCSVISYCFDVYKCMCGSIFIVCFIVSTGRYETNRKKRKTTKKTKSMHMHKSDDCFIILFFWLFQTVKVFPNYKFVFW